MEDLTAEDVYFVLDIPEEVAEEKGCTVLYPEPDQLMIDIDSDDAKKSFFKRLTAFDKACGPLGTIIKELPSPSGLPHRHYLVMFFRFDVDTCKRVPYKFESEWERICLQFYFGSDFNRESLNTLRLVVNEGTDSGNCLFQPKEEK